MKTAVEKRVISNNQPHVAFKLAATAPTPKYSATLNALKGSSIGDTAIAIDIETATILFKNIADEVQAREKS